MYSDSISSCSLEKRDLIRTESAGLLLQYGYPMRQQIPIFIVSPFSYLLAPDALFSVPIAAQLGGYCASLNLSLIWYAHYKSATYSSPRQQRHSRTVYLDSVCGRQYVRSMGLSLGIAPAIDAS